MPRTLPSGMEIFLQNQGSIHPIILLDIQTADGTNYFWSDFEGTYPAKLIGSNQFYNGWIKSAAPFVRARDLTTNAGSLTVQNISGSTVDRDVAAALKNHEFEGALAIMRIWLPLFDAAMDEFHCYLSEQSPTEDECTFRLLQLFDPAQYDVADDIISELCTWRFASAQCGSTGTATSCLKRLVDCQDPTRAAQERFNGVLTIVPTASIHTPPVGPHGPPHPPPRGRYGRFILNME